MTSPGSTIDDPSRYSCQKRWQQIKFSIQDPLSCCLVKAIKFRALPLSVMFGEDGAGLRTQVTGGFFKTSGLFESSYLIKVHCNLKGLSIKVLNDYHMKSPVYNTHNHYMQKNS